MGSHFQGEKKALRILPPVSNKGQYLDLALLTVSEHY